MDLRQFGPDDASAIRDCAAVRNAVRSLDSPWRHPATEANLAGHYRYGWDLEPETPFLAVVDGEVVGYASLRDERARQPAPGLARRRDPSRPPSPRPRHRRARGARRAGPRDSGRTSVGIAGWEGDVTRAFAARHGFELGSVAVNRRQILAEVDWADVERRRADARPHAEDYELIRRTGHDSRRRARRAGRDDGGDQRRAHRRPGHRGRGLHAGAGPRLRDGAARPGAGRRVPPAVRPPPRHRRAGRPDGRGRRGRPARSSASSTTRRWSGRTAATGWACSSRRR